MTARFARSLLVLVGLAALAFPSAAFAQSFSNTNSITINDAAAATPFPSTINVTGLTGNITGMTLGMSGFSHTFPDDVAAVVVGPTGIKVILFGGPSDGTAASDLDWAFDDTAAATLPVGGALASGTFRPGLDEYGDNLGVFAGGPAAPYGSAFADFTGTNGNGTWSLFVGDFIGGDSGTISGGWTLNFAAIPEPASLGLLGLAVPALLLRRPRN